MQDNTQLINRFTQAALDVAELYAELAQVDAVVIGGSLARSYTDEKSDIEMYVYYKDKMPTKEQIKNILKKLDAPLTRSKNVHWHHPAWGYHSFFKYAGIKFELGYRDIQATDKRMHDFMSELILPKHGIHDTPFGHYESGVASCITECKILVDKHGRIANLKKFLGTYENSKLKHDTFDYYLKDAKTIISVKAMPAAARGDVYNYHACISRAIRSLVIALFTVNNTYYPGDKWNGRYLQTFSRKPVDFQKRIEAVMQDSGKTASQKRAVCKELIKIADDIQSLY